MVAASKEIMFIFEPSSGRDVKISGKRTHSPCKDATTTAPCRGLLFTDVMETLLERLLNKNTPCAVLKYNVWLKTDNSVVKTRHELLWIDGINEWRTHILTSGEIAYFNSKIALFTIAAREDDGTAYEFGNFKNYKERLGVKHK